MDTDRRWIAQYRRSSDDFAIPLDDRGHPILAYSACLTEQGVIFGGRNRIYRYDYDSRSIKLLLDFSSDPYFAISAISRWDEETLLCCSRWQGLRLINLRSGERRLPPFDCGKEIMALLIDSHNRIWLAPYNEGLRCFNPEGRLLASYTTDNSGLSNNGVLSMPNGTHTSGSVQTEEASTSYTRTAIESQYSNIFREITIRFRLTPSCHSTMTITITCGQAVSAKD